jgi:vesicular inhibitory amino acid transporter
LVLAGFGGHAVVPGLARDMKHPGDFERVINRAFVSQRRGAK